MAPESRLHDTISTISHHFAACGGASGEAKVAVQSGSRSNRFFCILGHGDKVSFANNHFPVQFLSPLARFVLDWFYCNSETQIAML